MYNFISKKKKVEILYDSELVSLSKEKKEKKYSGACKIMLQNNRGCMVFCQQFLR